MIGLPDLRGDLDHPLHIGEHVGPIVMRRELAHPGVEDIEHIGAGLRLGQQELAGCGGKLRHQLVPELRLGEHEDARVFMIAALAAFDRIAGEGKGRSREANQRQSAGIELRAEQPNSFEREVHRFARIWRAERRDVGRTAHRIVDDRSFSLYKGKMEAHPFQGRQNVGKDNGRIEVEGIQRLEGDLGRQLRLFDELEQRVPLAQCPVFGHVPPSLTHQPDRRDVGRRAPNAFEKPAFRHRRRGRCHPLHQPATSFAKYVRIMSAPARLMPISDSMAQRCRSIQPFAAAAWSIAYSPLT